MNRRRRRRRRRSHRQCEKCGRPIESAYNTTEFAQCDECGYEMKVESDAVVDCPRKGCPGKIKGSGGGLY